MMEKQTHSFHILGYFGITEAFGRNEEISGNSRNLAIEVDFKVNSAKQAQQRFLTKYVSKLRGSWLIIVIGRDGGISRQFIIQDSEITNIWFDDKT